MSSVHIDIADDAAAAATDGFYSPAKQKAANRRPTVLTIQRARQTLCAAKVKLILAVLTFSFIIYVSSKLSSFMGWNPHYPSFVSSPSRGGYTVLINSWKQSSVLKQSVAHYASCRSVERIHVSWSGSEPPSEKLIARLNEIVVLKSEGAQKTDFIFEVISGDQLASRFRPKSYPNTDAIFSVDDNVIVPCPSLDFAFSVWQTAPLSMVGFVPRTHSVNKEQNNVAYYIYEGWWSVWWTGTYTMVLSKAAFFHRKYLDFYAHMSPSIQNYVANERSCEDIAMSLLVANVTGAPPVWVKGKIYEIGASSIGSLRGRSRLRNKCLNDLISHFGIMPLVPTNFKAVSAKNEWLW
ncbi:hypothetical protein Ahy_A05g022096 [Arachis hypogaea]|uniref:Glycosyl transferase 64 domain-containing protein n=1 Tax=Arachis hypogaea TaxID=3818 RepID=A0A445CZP9_ARAHY|nr:hypothetical protein Ahy_A05g022096 [Arachis hypogaea]